MSMTEVSSLVERQRRGTIAVFCRLPRSLFTLIYSLCLLLVQVQANAEQSEWTPFGPDNASVFAIEASPIDPLQMVVGSFFGGAYITHDGGQSWTHLVSPFSSSSVFSLAYSPASADTIYAGTFDVGLYKTEDGGVTWNRLQNGLTDPSIVDVAVDPHNPANLLTVSEAALFRSSDAGVTWAEVSVDPSVAPRVIAYDPAHPGEIYAGTLGSGVYHSTDGGNTWNPLSTGMGAQQVSALTFSQDAAHLYAATTNGAFRLQIGDSNWQNISYEMPTPVVNYIAEHPVDGRIFAATGFGIFSLTDGSNTWQLWADVSARRILIEPSASIIYVATTHSELVATVDDGQNFFPIGRGIQNVFAGALLGVEINGESIIYAGLGEGLQFTSEFFASNGIQPWINASNFKQAVFGLAAHPDNSGVLFAATESAGVWKSVDSGGYWTQASNGLLPTRIFSLSQSPVDTKTLYAGTNAGLYISRDDGLSWSPENEHSLSQPVLSVVVDPVFPGVAYASLPKGVFKTIDDGESFQLANTGLPATGQIASLTVAPFGNIYAVSADGQLYASDNEAASWFPAGSGINHSVTAMATDPVVPWKAYAATADGGVYRTLNNGISWQQINAGLNIPYVFSISVDATDGNVLYAGSVGAVFKSIDGGDTWQQNSNGLPNGFVTDIEVDTNLSTTLYASVDQSSIYKSTDSGVSWTLSISGDPYTGSLPIELSQQTAEKLFVGTYLEGIHVSGDGGVSYQPSSDGMTLFVRSIAIDTANPQRMYAASLVSGVFRTDDGGSSWKNMGLLDRNLFKVSLDPNNTDRVYVATSRGVALSTDGGANWVDLGQRSAYALSMLVDPNDRNRLFIGSLGGNVYGSDDGGRSWDYLSQGLPIANIIAMAMHPADRTLYASAEHVGVYKSSNGGQSWQLTGSLPEAVQVSSLLVNAGGRVLAATNGSGIFVSDDGGDNWDLTGLEDREQIYNLAFDAANPGVVFASTSLGVAQSIDDGDSWFELGQQSSFAFSMISDSRDRSIIYVGGASGELFKTRDNGKTWQKLSAGLPADNILALALDESRDLLFAGTERAGVYKSTDGGLSWISTGGAIVTEQVTSLSIDPLTGRVYAATNGGGVYSSDNEGVSWTSSATGLNSPIVTTVVADSAVPNRVYASTTSDAAPERGVYVSTDGGLTWQAVSTGIATAVVNSVSLSPTDPSLLYAATADGAYKSIDTAGSWAKTSNGLGGSGLLKILVDPLNVDRLIAVGDNQGLFISEDGAASWSSIDLGALSANPSGLTVGAGDRLFANTLGEGLLISDDRGNSWRPGILPGMVHATARGVTFDEVSNTLYVSLSGLGVVSSSDGGTSWTLLDNGLAGIEVEALHISADNSQVLLAATTANGVFKSINGGNLWFAANDPFNGIHVASFATGAFPDEVYAASTGFGLLVSNNAGDSWSGGVISDQAEPLITQMEINPVNTDVLYAAASGIGLLKSTDGGTGWELVSQGFTSQFILAIAIDPSEPDIVYVGTGDGVYVSEDAGASWVTLNVGLYNTNVTAIALDPVNPRIVYVGTEGGGVFRIDRTLPPLDSDGDFVPDTSDCAPNDPTIATLHAFFHDYDEDSFGIERVVPEIPPDFYIETAIDICQLAPPRGFVPWTGDPWDFDGFRFIPTVEKEGRKVAVDFSRLSETGGFSADQLIDLGVDASALQLYWSEIETGPGIYNGPQASALQTARDLYSDNNLQLSLTISPISSQFLTLPGDLRDGIYAGTLRMSDAEVIDRFRDMLTYLHRTLSGVEMVSVQLGYEIDLSVSELTIPGFWEDYSVFYDAVFTHAKTLWGVSVPVSTTFTAEGFLDPDFAPLVDIFQTFDDVVSLSFFPRNDDFSIIEPEGIEAKLTAITDAAALRGKPVYIQAMGYPTAPATGSSTTKQSQFINEFFQFWDAHFTEIPFVSLGVLHDSDFAVVESQVAAGLVKTSLELSDKLTAKRVSAYLSSLGYRTYNGDGAHKPGYNTLRNHVFDRGWFRDTERDSRPYLMGFTTAAYDLPTEPAEQISASDWLRNRLKQDSDITMLHFDGGVPWVEAYADDFSSPELPYSDAVKGAFLKNREDIPAGSKVAVSINPLGVPRHLLAPYWGYGQGFDYDADFNRIPNGNLSDDEKRYSPAPWDSYTFTDEPVRTAYLNYCKRVLKYFKPDYLVIGIEVNAALVHDTAAYEAYFELHKYVYNALKSDAEFGHIPIMVSFSATSYMIDEFGVAYKYDEQEPGVRDYQLDALERFLPYTDIIGLSYYPHFGKYNAYTLSAMLYDELFELLAHLGAEDKPIAITESGFTADPYSILDGFVYTGSEAKQARYFDLLFRELYRQKNPIEFIINFKLRDSDLGWQRQVDALGPTTPEGSANFVEFLKFFRDIGIYDGDGVLRLGGAKWLSQLALPHLPVVASANKVEVASPNGGLMATFEMGITRQPYFTLSKEGRHLLGASPLGLVVDGIPLENATSSMTATTPVTSVDSIESPGVSAGSESYSAFTLTINRDDLTFPVYEIDVRAYDDGIAFRYRIPGVGEKFVSGESTAWALPSGSLFWAQHDLLNYQGEYTTGTVSALEDPVGAPLTLGLQGGGYILITEADLNDYSGMVLTVENPGSRLLEAQFPFDSEWSVLGGSTTPWRVAMYSDDLNGLVNSNMIASLNPPPDTSLFSEGVQAEWIKPGKALWPGLSNPDLGYDFYLQMTQIWYASVLGFDYVMLEPGWEEGFPYYGYSDPFDALNALTAFANSDGQAVGIIVWKAADQLHDPVIRQTFLDNIAAAGAAGVRIDYVSSESQLSNGFIQSLRQEAAERHLLVTFDKVPKPTGESRSHPNEMGRSAVRGLDWSGGIAEVTPSHNVTLPFTRQIVGSTDYKVVNFDPLNSGSTTFTHQLAMAGILSSPMQTWVASGENLFAQSHVLDVIMAMPTVWDETRVLNPSAIGDIALIARRSGERWFLFIANGKTNGVRQLDAIDLSFLGTGYFNAVELGDQGATSISRNDIYGIASDYILDVSMEPGGGHVMMFTPFATP